MKFVRITDDKEIKKILYKFFNYNDDIIKMISKHYYIMSEIDDEYTNYYFCNKNYKLDIENSTTALYKSYDYVINKLIDEKTYRVVFDPTGIILIKLIFLFIEGGISGVIFAIAESFSEYLITSNVKLNPSEACILYTILLDDHCINEYFDAKYLYSKYYESIKNRKDSCLFNCREQNGYICFYNECDNSCEITTKDIENILNSMYNKKIFIKNEFMGKYKLR